jgi:two-component system catabolic regulation response regulator CreB/two-component system response regulator ChvI
VSTKKKYRILVVDDEPDITTIVKKGLEQEGFDVDTFNDPQKALDHFKSGRYELALLDIRMSPINGFELYRRLESIDQNTKICFITAFEIYYDEFRRVFPRIAVDCFVRKPFRMSDLAAVIKRQLDILSEADRLQK